MWRIPDFDEKNIASIIQQYDLQAGLPLSKWGSACDPSKTLQSASSRRTGRSTGVAAKLDGMPRRLGCSVANPRENAHAAGSICHIRIVS
jgi:hypothetical protein